MYYFPQTDTVFDSVADFQAAFPHTSFGDLAYASEREAAGLFWLRRTPPEHDSELQHLEDGPIVKDGSAWVQTFHVVDRELPADERLGILKARFDAALAAHMDAVAGQRGFDNRITASIRAGYPGPFQALGLAFSQWMDACLIHADETLAAVQAGAAPPASTDAFIATLPTIEWPT